MRRPAATYAGLRPDRSRRGCATPYIYEDAWGERRVRQFDPLEAVTLDDYRRRYTQYRTDPDLQAAHAACPWHVTWDDHEVDNDYVGLTSEHELCGGEAVRSAFPARRAAAYQAWFEHMPVRPSRLRADMGVQIYGSSDWGRLARFYVLDTRQYRSVQVCPTPPTLRALRSGKWPQDPVRQCGRRHPRQPDGVAMPARIFLDRTAQTSLCIVYWTID